MALFTITRTGDEVRLNARTTHLPLERYEPCASVLADEPDAKDAMFMLALDLAGERFRAYSRSN